MFVRFLYFSLGCFLENYREFIFFFNKVSLFLFMFLLEKLIRVRKYYFLFFLKGEMCFDLGIYIFIG